MTGNPRLDDLLRQAADPAEQGPLRTALFGPEQAYFALVTALVADGDVAALTLLRDGRTDLHALISDTVDKPQTEGGLLKGLRVREDSALTRACRDLAGLGAALAAKAPDLPEPGEYLAGFEAAHASLTGGSIVALDALWRALSGAAFQVTASAAIGVAFTGTEGVAAELRATLNLGLPNGLAPDPRRMSLFRADPGFQSALDTAWRLAGGDHLDGAVLWTIERGRTPITEAHDRSLGLAFTLVLDELRRTSTRFGRLRYAHRLARDNVAIGAVAPSGALETVQGYDRKLAAIGRPARVVLPEADHDRAAGQRPAEIDLSPAADWRSAAKLARRTNGNTRARQLLAAGLALALVVGSGVSWYLLGVKDDEQRRHKAAELAALSTSLDVSSPLAPLLALAANHIDAAEPSVDDALVRVAQNNPSVANRLHTGESGVTTGVFDGRGDILYTASQDGTVAAWDPVSSRRLGAVASPQSYVLKLAKHPRLPLLAGADARGGVTLWRTDGKGGSLSDPVPLASTGPSGATLGGLILEAVDLVGFTTTGNRVYVISTTGRVRAWDVTSHDLVLDKEIRDLKGLSGTSSGATALTASAAVPADDPERAGWAYVADSAGRIVRLDLDTGRAEEVVSDRGLAGKVTALTVMDFYGRHRLAVGTDSGVQVWNAEDHTREESPVPGLSAVVGLSYNSSDRTLAVATAREVRLVSTAESQVEPASNYAFASGPPVYFLADGGEWTAVGQGGGDVTILDPSNHRLGQPSAPASTVGSFGRDGRMLVTGALTGQKSTIYTRGLHLIAPRGPQEPPGTYPVGQGYSVPETWWPPSSPFYANDAVLTDDLVLVSGQAPLSAISRRQGVVLVWDARTSAPVRKLDFPGGDLNIVSTVRAVPALSMIVARNIGGQLRGWSTKTWDQVLDLTVGLGGGLEIRPGTTTAVMPVLASNEMADADQSEGALLFVDLKTGATRSVVTAGRTTKAVFTPSGDRLITVVGENRLRYLTPDGMPEKGAPTIELPGFITDVAVDSKGERVAVAVENGSIFIYDLRSGALAMPPLTVTDGTLPVLLSWDPEGDLLAANMRGRANNWNQGGPLRFWPTRKNSWSAQMCALAGRDITPEEWKRYVDGMEEYRKLCEGRF